jgi:dTDP-4-dehydrorhamnose reductase
MRAMILGCNGQVGWELARTFPPDWTILPIDRTQLDLAHPGSVGEAVRVRRPDVIINAAAYTAVDRAESEPDLAHRINAESVAVLADEARKLGAAIVHFSTDYVFAGTGDRPYRPDDPPDPQSVYGRTKLAGERAVVNSGAAFLILRTCWVYALRGRNFLLAMLKQAQTKPEVRVVNDQTGSPTWARVLAQATAHIVTGNLAGDARQRHFCGREGVYHLACGGSTTWFEFARAIFSEARLPNGGPRVIPVSSAEFAAKARRPAYSTLDCTRTTEVFGVHMPDWRAALQQAIADRNALAALHVSEPVPDG